MRKIFSTLLVFVFLTVGVLSGLFGSFVQNANSIEAHHKQVSSHHSHRNGEGDAPGKHCLEKCIKRFVLTSSSKEQKFIGFTPDNQSLHFNIWHDEMPGGVSISKTQTIHSRYPNILLINLRTRI